MPSPTSYRYKDAGVDIAAGNKTVDLIRDMIATTRRPGAEANIGGFGGLFDLKAAGYHDPLLVAATDGVGTKLRLAIETGNHKSVGIDLVAMCVNDLIVQGAEPLFFLDYIATGKIDPDHMADIVSGIVLGCKQAGCALIGGETAEMPGHYAQNDYDLAGFTVGAVNRDQLLPTPDIQAGDILLALPSSGIHSNGYSLVRRLIADFKLNLSQPAPFSNSHTLGEALMIPTRIYVDILLPILKETDNIKALAHITGGGLLENIPRILPQNLTAHIHRNKLPNPKIFQWLQELGNIEDEEMWRSFNCGIGMVAIVRPTQVDALMTRLAENGEKSFIIGEILHHQNKAIVIQ